MINRSQILLAASLMLCACGGSTTTTDTTYQTPKVEPEQPLIDIQVNNDSKGIGKFSNVVLAPINAASAEKGKAVFRRTCAGCHALTTDRLQGPGLKNITQIRTPEWILNMVTNPEENTRKDPLGKALLKEYRVVMVYQNNTDKEAEQILEYLRQNDAK